MMFRILMQQRDDLLCRGDVLEILDSGDADGDGMYSIYSVDDAEKGEVTLVGANGKVMTCTIPPNGAPLNNEHFH